MNDNSEKKISIDLGSASSISQKWGVVGMCHNDSNYDIVTTDVGKRFFKSTIAITDRLINAADHVKTFNNKGASFTCSLPLILLDGAADLENEITYSLSLLRRDDNLITVKLKNEQEFELSVYSLLSYIVWYIFYRHVKKSEHLYTEMFSIMMSKEMKEKLDIKVPVIAVPPVFSRNHIHLLQYSFSQYHLPNCVFVDQSIAFAMSYAYFLSKETEKQEYFLVANLGEVFFTLTLMSYSKEKITIHYETCTSSIGGRDFAMAFKEYVIESSGDERLKNPAFHRQMMDLINGVRQNICSLNLPSGDITLDELFNYDEDCSYEVTQEGFFAYCERTHCFERFRKEMDPMVKYLQDHSVKVSEIIPIGGGLHFEKLRLILQEAFSPFSSNPSLCMSVNMDEDISGGAVRLSHLIVEKSVTFDPLLQNHGVVDCGKNHLFSKAGRGYRIECSEDFAKAYENMEWKTYDTLTEEDMTRCQERIQKDVQYLLKKTENDEKETKRVHDARDFCEKKCAILRKKCGNKQDERVFDLCARVNRASTFNTKESTMEFIKELEVLLKEYNCEDCEDDYELDAIDDEDDDDDEPINKNDHANSPPPVSIPGIRHASPHPLIPRSINGRKTEENTTKRIHKQMSENDAHGSAEPLERTVVKIPRCYSSIPPPTKIGLTSTFSDGAYNRSALSSPSRQRNNEGLPVRFGSPQPSNNPLPSDGRYGIPHETLQRPLTVGSSPSPVTRVVSIKPPTRIAPDPPKGTPSSQRPRPNLHSPPPPLKPVMASPPVPHPQSNVKSASESNQPPLMPPPPTESFMNSPPKDFLAPPSEFISSPVMDKHSSESNQPPLMPPPPTESFMNSPPKDFLAPPAIDIHSPVMDKHSSESNQPPLIPLPLPAQTSKSNVNEDTNKNEVSEIDRNQNSHLVELRHSLSTDPSSSSSGPVSIPPFRLSLPGRDKSPQPLRTVSLHSSVPIPQPRLSLPLSSSTKLPLPAVTPSPKPLSSSTKLPLPVVTPSPKPLSSSTKLPLPVVTPSPKPLSSSTNPPSPISHCESSSTISEPSSSLNPSGLVMVKRNTLLGGSVLSRRYSPANNQTQPEQMTPSIAGTQTNEGSVINNPNTSTPTPTNEGSVINNPNSALNVDQISNQLVEASIEEEKKEEEKNQNQSRKCCYTRK